MFLFTTFNKMGLYNKMDLDTLSVENIKKRGRRLTKEEAKERYGLFDPVPDEELEIKRRLVRVLEDNKRGRIELRRPTVDELKWFL